MEFLRGIYDGCEVLGIKCGERVYFTGDFEFLRDACSMVGLIEVLDEANLSKLRCVIDEGLVDFVFVDEIRLLSPIARPIHDVVCVGINYSDHLAEVQGKIDISEAPSGVYFSKRACSLVGPDEVIEGHLDLDHRLDYEVELAVIIGKKGRDIPKDRADEFIFGYCIFNDVTARSLQKDHGQWFRGKSLDGFSILGPWIVEKSQLPFPISLDITCSVNGELRQSSNTSFFIRDIPTLIEELSRGLTLEPGDIIVTGTPSGVGMGFRPSRFLKSGDCMVCEIEGIGVLRNTVR